MDKKVIFIHIPKTAGTTLARVFKENYVFWPKDRVYIADAATKAQQLLTMSAEEQERIRLVHGHLEFGVHEKLGGDCVYVTYLREPEKRVLSFYNHIMADSSHYMHEQVAKANMGFSEFLQSGLSLELDNLQVRMLTGNEGAPIGGLSREHLELALANIEKFMPVVGLTEYFDEALLLMRQKIGWKFFPFYVRARVNEVPSLRYSDLDEETLQLAREVNGLDTELYTKMKERLEGQIEVGGSKLSRAVQRFRRFNRIFQMGMKFLPVYK